MRTLEEWARRFGAPVKSPEDSILFETNDEEYELVQAADPRCVWTLVEVDDDRLLLTPGLQYVNRVNYVISTTPLPHEEEDQWWDVDWGTDLYSEPEFDFLEETNPAPSIGR